MIDACSCGEPHPHVVAERRTFDGHGVELWSDGAILTPFGHRVRGVPMRRPRTSASHRLAMRAGWLFMGEACITSDDDLGALYEACVAVAARGGEPGDVRTLLRATPSDRATLQPSWTVLSTDARGTPTERVWRLPRMLWPGLVVFDFCGGPGSAGGRYVLYQRQRSVGAGGVVDDALHPTGFRFSRLSDLEAHLRSLSPADRA